MNISNNLVNASNNSISLLTNNKNNNISNKVNKRKKPLKWSDSDTELFFRSLEIFGEDLKSINKVFIKKTQRQLLRKMHNEKKRNPEYYYKCWENHKKGLPKEDYNFFEELMKKTSEDEEDINNSSFDSLDLIVNKKLAMICEYPDPDIKSIDFYLNEIQ